MCSHYMEADKWAISLPYYYQAVARAGSGAALRGDKTPHRGAAGNQAVPEGPGKDEGELFILIARSASYT